MGTPSHLSTTPSDGFGPSWPLQTTPSEDMGPCQGNAQGWGVRDVDGRDGTWTEGTGRHVDRGDGTARGRTDRDTHTNLSKQHPPWV